MRPEAIKNILAYIPAPEKSSWKWFALLCWGLLQPRHMGNSLAAQSPLRESFQEGEQSRANQGSGLP